MRLSLKSEDRYISLPERSTYEKMIWWSGGRCSRSSVNWIYRATFSCKDACSTEWGAHEQSVHGGSIHGRPERCEEVSLSSSQI